MSERSAKRKRADAVQEVLNKWLPAEAEQDPLVQELRQRLRDYFTSRAATVRGAPGFVYKEKRGKRRERPSAADKEVCFQNRG